MLRLVGSEEDLQQIAPLCCTGMDAGELQHEIMKVYRTAFPRLEVVHIAEAGHA